MLLDDRDGIAVRNTVVAVTAIAWALVIWPQRTMDPHVHASGPSALLLAAGAAGNWLLMLTSMMAPVLIRPIRFLRGHGLARRRTRATLLFLAGYVSTWTVAGAAILFIATAARETGVPPVAAAAAALTVAAIWQCSPAKQTCLNRCHVRPPLATFGRRADRDVTAYGAAHAWWCIGSCWALMLVPPVLPAWHTAAMMAAAVLIVCERLDRPARPGWQWRGLGMAWRIAAGQLRMQQRAAARAWRPAHR